MANKLVSLLSGGINNNTSPLIIKDSENELILNYRLDTVGALTKRNGYDVFATQPVAGKRVHGLFQYTNTSSSVETTQVMVVNNSGDTFSVIYYNNAGTWTTSKTDDTAVATFTNFNRARFVTFLDYLFRVNGVDVVNTSNNVNGSVWGTTNAPTVITPSFIAVYEDRVYVARNGVAAGSRVYYSGLPSSGAITWTTGTDFFDVNPDDGDEITALENNGNRLLIFKNRAMYRWQFGQTEPDRIIGVGTPSQECVKTNFDLGITFFANERGAYAYTGGRPKLISRKIQKWFDAIPAADLDDMAADTDADHYYLYLSDSMTVDGRTYTNVMAVYTISLNAWVIYTLNTPIRVMNKLIQSGAEDIYFGSSNGRTYQWDIGTGDDSGGASGNTATPIAAEVITKEHMLSFPKKTHLNHIDIIASQRVGAKVSYSVDRNVDFIPLGELIDRVMRKRLAAKEIQTIRLRLSDNSFGQSIIEGYNIEHTPIDKEDAGDTV